MKPLTNLLIIGGTGRNTGKTELACRIIAKICKNQPVFGAKTSDIAPGSGIRRDETASEGGAYHIYEEVNSGSGKDTARMLRAGARRVFYLQSDDRNLSAGFLKLFRALPENMPLVCESNTLAQYLTPGLFLVVTRAEIKKDDFRDRLAYSDAVFVSDGRSGFKELEGIRFTDGGWVFEPA